MPKPAFDGATQVSIQAKLHRSSVQRGISRTLTLNRLRRDVPLVRLAFDRRVPCGRAIGEWTCSRRRAA